MGALDEIVKAKKDYGAMLQSFGEEKLVDVYAEYFAAHPLALAVKWRQYTPNFNDGDPCTFEVHEHGVLFDGADEESGDYEDGFCSAYCIQDDDPAKVEKKAAIDATPDVPDDLLEAIFGDGQTVTMRRDGTIDEEECDHD